MIIAIAPDTPEPVPRELAVAAFSGLPVTEACGMLGEMAPQFPLKSKQIPPRLFGSLLSFPFGGG
jgi:hypothetical protein